MDEEADRLKDKLYDALKRVLESEDFVHDADVADPEYCLGVHSTKKHGTTDARRKGVPKDFVDYRARWKNKRIQESYMLALSCRGLMLEQHQSFA